MPDDKTTDTLPDRLSNDPRSPFYDENALKRDIGVRFKGVDKSNVEEYCVSENWVRVSVGKSKDRYGNPLTLKLTGTVEPYFKNAKAEPEARPEPEVRPEKDQRPASAETHEKAAKPVKPAAKRKEPAKPVKPAKKKKK